MIIRICKICQKVFKKHNSDLKIKGRGQYCGRICKNIAQKEKQKGRKFTEKTIRHFSEIRKGKRLGKDNTFYGKKHTTKTKELIGNAQKGRSAGVKNYFYGKNLCGDKSHRWKGGITPITQKIRHSDKYMEWRRKIFIRDHFTCDKCNKVGGVLEAHHKYEFNKIIKDILKHIPLKNLYEAAMAYIPMWDLNNGITHCFECHNIKGLHHVK